jgi:hypothetical protein
MPSPDGLAKIERLGVADLTKFSSDFGHREPRCCRPTCNQSTQKQLYLLTIWGREGETQLETSPDCAVQKFRMVGRGDDDDVARHLVELHQQKRNNPLDLARLMSVAAFFPDGIEFIEEQDAGLRSNVVEQLSKPSVSLTQETAD